MYSAQCSYVRDWHLAASAVKQPGLYLYRQLTVGTDLHYILIKRQDGMTDDTADAAARTVPDIRVLGRELDWQPVTSVRHFLGHLLDRKDLLLIIFLP